MEKTVEVNTFTVGYACDECKDGEMVFVGLLGADPKQCSRQIEKGFLFQHVCQGCKKERWFENKRYPTMKYEPVQNEKTAESPSIVEQVEKAAVKVIVEQQRPGGVLSPEAPKATCEELEGK